MNKNPASLRTQFPLPKWPQYANNIRKAAGIARRVEEELEQLEKMCAQYYVEFDPTEVEYTAALLIKRITYVKQTNENSPTFAVMP